jgi:phospholipid/cholesterol/gamma-HCH transport system substrate-binding protein
LIFLLIALMTLGLLVVALGGVRFWEDLDAYDIRFDSVKTLSVGRPVMYQGIQAGRVTAIQVDPESPNKILVRIGLQGGFALYQGTTATISQKGLVGDNYVLLQLRDDPGPLLAPGSEIPSKSMPDMNAVVARMGAVIENIGPRINRIAENLEKIVSVENSENLRKTIARAPVLMNKMERSLDEIQTAIESSQQDWSEIAQAATDGISTGQKCMETITSDLTGTLADVRQAVNQTSKNLNRTLDLTREHIDAAGGNVGELTAKLNEDWDYDQERLEIVLENLAGLTEELKMLSRSLRERPWQIIHTPEEGELP